MPPGCHRRPRGYPAGTAARGHDAHSRRRCARLRAALRRPGHPRDDRQWAVAGRPSPHRAARSRRRRQRARRATRRNRRRDRADPLAPIAGFGNAQRRAPAVGSPAAGVRPGLLHLGPGARPPTNGPDRRWGTSRLVRTILDVPHAHRHANPNAPRVGVGDLSPRGGGRNPRRDRRLRAPAHSWQIDRALAQDLVDRFVRAVAERIFVDTRLGLGGPPGVVQHRPNHGDHLHLRLHGDQNRWAPGDSPRGRRAEATAPAGAAVSGARPRAPGRAPG
jgi:hypothetical protein